MIDKVMAMLLETYRRNFKKMIFTIFDMVKGMPNDFQCDFPNSP